MRYSISNKLNNNLQSVLNGTFTSRGNELYIGETSNFLIETIGARALNVTMPANKAYSAMVTEKQAKADGRYDAHTNYHGLGVDGLIHALEASENPIAAFAAIADKNNKRSNYIVLVTDEIVDGKNIVVVEAVDTKAILDGKRADANKVITSYDRESIATDIERAAAEGRLLSLDKKRSQAILAGVKGSNSPVAIREADFKRNIQNFWANVKWEKESNNGVLEIKAEGEKSTFAAAYEKAQKKTDSEKSNTKNIDKRADAGRYTADRITEFAQDSGGTASTNSSASNNSIPNPSEKSNTQNKESKKYYDLIDQYGAYERGENAAREVEVPRRSGEREYVRRFIRTAMEASATNDDMLGIYKERIENGAFSYHRISDKETIAKTEELIVNDYEKAVKIWNGVVAGNKTATKQDIAIGEALYIQAAQKGDYGTAMRIMAELAAEGTRAGQTVQALHMLKKMPGVAQVYYIQQTIDNLQKDLDKRYGSKAPRIHISDELISELEAAQGEKAVDARYLTENQAILHRTPGGKSALAFRGGAVYNKATIIISDYIRSS